MSHILAKTKDPEIKRRISNLIFTYNVSTKHEDSSVFFAVEKEVFGYLKYAVFFVTVLLIFYAIKLSPIITICFVILFTVSIVSILTCTVRKESVHLFVPVGLQVNAIFLLGNKSSTFIPWSSIQDFLIVEVITRQRVIYCLIVLVEDLNGRSYVTIFENTKPRLVILQEVYKKLQTILIEQRKRSNS